LHESLFSLPFWLGAWSNWALEHLFWFIGPSSKFTWFNQNPAHWCCTEIAAKCLVPALHRDHFDGMAFHEFSHIIFLTLGGFMNHQTFHKLTAIVQGLGAGFPICFVLIPKICKYLSSCVACNIGGHWCLYRCALLL
jgi:hypothetical protein